MVGIAAGVALKELEEQMYSDVIVANSVWNYEFGKFVSASDDVISFGSIGFQPRSASLDLLAPVCPYVQAAINSPENQNHVHIGPIASGSSVVTNSEVLAKQIHSQQRMTAGLDMEAYAVAYAAAHALRRSLSKVSVTMPIQRNPINIRSSQPIPLQNLKIFSTRNICHMKYEE